ncbi:MAG: hypothetical protein J4G04_01765 [Nitrosopumilaceae archaeon]|nr:hypothetical protein [Nitrosopumilaceae archaeon]
MSRRRAYAAAGAAVLVAAVALGAAGPGDTIPDTFQIQATYQDGHVTISFADASGGTTRTVVEVLGMGETFHRTYGAGGFEERIPFPSPPRYGWGAHPVIFDIRHDTLGDLRIKTEIRDAGEPPAPLLLER